MKTELEERTKKFAVTVIRDVLTFPRNVAVEVIGRQLLRSATSIGANYREANRAESRGDFIHKTRKPELRVVATPSSPQLRFSGKIGIAEKEAAETQYWLEICLALKLGKPDLIQAHLSEAGELLAILSTIGKKARTRVK